MLSLLHIENIALIESADIRFEAGFNVLTGETGAGKSIVIDSIGAVLGERTSRELIRTGARSALVTAVFTGVPPLAWLVENGFSTGREELLLQRELQGVNVSKRLAVFIGNYPDYYETYRPKMDGPFVPSVKDEKGHYIANAAYKDVPGAQLRIGNLPRTESTGVHSIDDLVVGARGPHADAFRGFMNSTEVFRIMSEALALGNK